MSKIFVVNGTISSAVVDTNNLARSGYNERHFIGRIWHADVILVNNVELNMADIFAIGFQNHCVRYQLDPFRCLRRPESEFTKCLMPITSDGLKDSRLIRDFQTEPPFFRLGAFHRVQLATIELEKYLGAIGGAQQFKRGT